MEDKFYLPIGLVHEGQDVTELEVADTGSGAEEVYTKKPGQTKLYSWFAKVIAASVAFIGQTPISAAFFASKKDDRGELAIPDAVLNIPLLDAGSLLVQIQTLCWQPVIKDQRIMCINCKEQLQADMELKRIPIPKQTGKVPTTFIITLDRTYTINTGISQLEAYEGVQFNKLLCRVPTLRDAINHEAIAKDDVLFWRKISFDCIEAFMMDEEEVAEGYLPKRGLLLFSKDFNSMTLKGIRESFQVDLPSVKYYYEEECYECGRPTPFYASSANFFTT